MVLPCNQLLIGWRTWLAEMGIGPSRPNKNTLIFKIMKSYKVVLLNSIKVHLKYHH